MKKLPSSVIVIIIIIVIKIITPPNKVRSRRGTIIFWNIELSSISCVLVCKLKERGLRERENLQDLGVDGRIILKSVF